MRNSYGSFLSGPSVANLRSNYMPYELEHPNGDKDVCVHVLYSTCILLLALLQRKARSIMCVFYFGRKGRRLFVLLSRRKVHVHRVSLLWTFLQKIPWRKSLFDSKTACSPLCSTHVWVCLHWHLNLPCFKAFNIYPSTRNGGQEMWKNWQYIITFWYIAALL